jgi:tryptophanase
MKMNIRLSTGKVIPVEMHKVRIVQRTTLPEIRRRLEAIGEAGYNTFLLRTRDVFLDMLTDSGTNAMSDNQLAAMMVSDDAYAGSESFYKLADSVKEILGFEYTIPVHRVRCGAPAKVCKRAMFFDELPPPQPKPTWSTATTVLRSTPMRPQHSEPEPFQFDLAGSRPPSVVWLRDPLSAWCTTNLIGGQPFSLENLMAVKKITAEHKIPLVFDGSLISENAYFIKQREKKYAGKSIRDIIREMMGVVDIFYLSGRKSTSVRGGLMATNEKKYYDRILAWLPVYEGFATYGGMSTKEVEAMAVGLREMTETSVAGSSPDLIQYFVDRLLENGVPVVTPAGGLACHIDAKRFLPHLPQAQYPAGALAAAIYIASGVRSMERGTISMDRDAQGNEVYADLELARLAVPRRVYTMSHIEYAVDRLTWLHRHSELVGGLRFIEEPKVLRFFFGRLEPLANWGAKLGKAFEHEFGAEL